MTLPHLQTLAASMQALARPNPDQSHPFVIETRIRELDGLFWDHEWGVKHRRFTGGGNGAGRCWWGCWPPA